MSKIIDELKKNMELELKQIGLTPHTDFKGSQKQHDNMHRKKAKEYKNAIKILSAKEFLVRDWMVAEDHYFTNFKKAELFYNERVEYMSADGGECDVQFSCIIAGVNNLIK